MAKEDMLNQQVIRASDMAVMQVNELLKRTPNAVGQTDGETATLTPADIKRLARRD
jgi:hypothetical protein